MVINCQVQVTCRLLPTLLITHPKVPRKVGIFALLIYLCIYLCIFLQFRDQLGNLGAGCDVMDVMDVPLTGLPRYLRAGGYLSRYLCYNIYIHRGTWASKPFARDAYPGITYLVVTFGIPGG